MRYILPILLFLLVAFTGCDEESTTIETSSETRVNTFTFYKDTANLGLTEASYKIEHLSDTGHALTVFRIGYTKPFAGGIEYFDGSGAFADELVYHQRNEEFALQVFHVLRIGQEFLEIGRAHV